MHITSNQPSDLEECYIIDEEDIGDQESCPHKREIGRLLGILTGENATLEFGGKTVKDGDCK